MDKRYGNTLPDYLYADPAGGAHCTVPTTVDESGFAYTVKYQIEPVLEYGLYLMGITTIILGAIMAVVTGAQDIRKKRSISESLTHMRVHLSQSLTLSLTFILGAEILKTFRVPNLFQLIKVMGVVLLRQLITYFLDKDVLRLRKEFPDLK